MPRHQVLTRLAERFEICWVDPAIPWRKTFKKFEHSFGQCDTFGAKFQVYVPPWYLPKFYRPEWMRRFMMRVRLAHARQKLAKRGCTTFVLYLWRPQFAEALDLVEHDYSCYHIDDEYSFASESSLIHPIEEELLKRVDQVIIHCLLYTSPSPRDRG